MITKRKFQINKQPDQCHLTPVIGVPNYTCQKVDYVTTDIAKGTEGGEAPKGNSAILLAGER